MWKRLPPRLLSVLPAFPPPAPATNTHTLTFANRCPPSAAERIALPPCSFAAVAAWFPFSFAAAAALSHALPPCSFAAAAARAVAEEIHEPVGEVGEASGISSDP